MYALAPSFSTTTTAGRPTRTITPNLLPCKIHHSGPVLTSPRYWSPTITTTTSSPSTSANGITKPTTTRTSYFRGRKLAGRALVLPDGYTGLVLQKTDQLLPVKPKVVTAEELRAMEEGNDDDDGLGEGRREDEVEVKMLERKAEFEELVVWGHENVPEGDDVYVRGVEEWVGFAEAMHCDDQPIATETNGTT